MLLVHKVTPRYCMFIDFSSHNNRAHNYTPMDRRRKEPNLAAAAVVRVACYQPINHKAVKVYGTGVNSRHREPLGVPWTFFAGAAKNAPSEFAARKKATPTFAINTLFILFILSFYNFTICYKKWFRNTGLPARTAPRSSLTTETLWLLFIDSLP